MIYPVNWHFWRKCQKTKLCYIIVKYIYIYNVPMIGKKTTANNCGDIQDFPQHLLHRGNLIIKYECITELLLH